MLNNSTSPHSALKSLQSWRALPETQEVIAHLQTKAKTAQVEGTKSPLVFPMTENGPKFSMETIRCYQDRQNGSVAGFSELERILDETQTNLESAIKLIDEEQQQKQQSST